jgi:8-oxo-dGTP diphosphatase
VPAVRGTGRARYRLVNGAPDASRVKRHRRSAILDHVPLRSTCLCLLLRTRDDGVREVLLGYKKTGIGTGKIVGLGGHVEPGESAAEAAAREVKEESGIRVAEGGLAEAAHVTFLFPVRPSWDMDVVIFTCEDWAGDPAESAEIRPQWYPVADLPFSWMWDDAPYWLPPVLAGERVRATFSYADDCETVADASVGPLS